MPSAAGCPAAAPRQKLQKLLFREHPAAAAAWENRP
jgi:hypothetical protein